MSKLIGFDDISESTAHIDDTSHIDDDNIVITSEELSDDDDSDDSQEIKKTDPLIHDLAEWFCERFKQDYDVVRNKMPRTLNQYVVDGGSAHSEITDDHTYPHVKRKPYTVDAYVKRNVNKNKFAKYGCLDVDLPRLRRGRLIAYKTLPNGEKEIAYQADIDECTKQLLTRSGVNCLSNQKYTKDEKDNAIRVLREITGAGKLRPHKCPKYEVIYGKPKIYDTVRFVHYQSPDELLKRLQILEASKNAGNDGNNLLEAEKRAIVEHMFEKGFIGEEEYEKLIDL